MELKADSIRISFSNRPILHGAYINCSIGETVGLLGRNGSGKSTLLKTIAQTMSSDDAYIGISGERPITPSSAYNYMAYLPQESYLPKNEKLSTIMHLSLGKAEHELMCQNELVQKLYRQKCKTFSGGELRFIEILFMLYANAPFVLLDEPFNGLAPLYREHIMQLITQQSQTKGIIITDHDYRNVLEISDRQFLLVGGRTIAVANKEELVRYGYLPSNR